MTLALSKPKRESEGHAIMVRLVGAMSDAELFRVNMTAECGSELQGIVIAEMSDRKLQPVIDGAPEVR